MNKFKDCKCYLKDCEKCKSQIEYNNKMREE